MADEASSERPIIIIKKKKKGGHEHHGGAWKVAFADFMTAMFALFLVLWILTQSQEVKAAIANYFRHPTDYEGKPDATFRGNDGLMESKQGRLDNMQNILQIEARASSSSAAGSEGATPESIAGGLASPTAEPGLRPDIIERVEEQEKDEVKSFLKIADELWMTLGMDPSFKRFKDNLLIETIEDGLVIQLIEQPKSPLFEDGTMEFRPPIKQAINILAKHLANYPNKIEIDGHGNFPANNAQRYVLSQQMADAARITLELGGLKSTQISKVAGCGNARPLNPRNLDDPLNRRVSMLVRPRQWRPERY
jgi:chemotaxis protein MotB